MPTVKKETLILRVNPRFKQRLERLASAKNTTVSELSRVLLESSLKVEEDRYLREKEHIKEEIYKIEQKIKVLENEIKEIDTNTRLVIYDVLKETDILNNPDKEVEINPEIEKDLDKERDKRNLLLREIDSLELTKSILMSKL
jgi:DNA-binding ferritin-like protein